MSMHGCPFVNYGHYRSLRITAGMQFAYTRPNSYGLRILAERYTKADTIEGEMRC